MIPGKTILVIDTDRDTMQNIISILESADYLVFTASSKSDSITVAQKVNPSLIYINIGMTGASGLDISKTIHDEKSLRKIPIVILTPHGGTVEPRYTSIYGIVDFLKTSFTPEELIAKTREILAGSFFTEEPSEDVSVPESPEKAPAEQPEEQEQVQAKQAEEKIIHPPVEPESSVEIVEEKAEPVQAAPHPEDTSGTVEPDSGAPVEDRDDRQPSGKKGMPLFERAEDIYTAEELSEDEESEATAETKKRKMSLMPYLIIVFVIIGAAGTFLYWNFLRASKVREPAPVQVKPSVTETQQAPPAFVRPSVEEQQPQKSKGDKQTVPVQPERKAKGADKPVEKPGYAIQIGVFKNKQNALLTLKKFHDKGYKTRIHSSKQKGEGIVYRVLIGNYQSKSEAVRQAQKIQSREEIDVMIFHTLPL